MDEDAAVWIAREHGQYHHRPQYNGSQAQTMGRPRHQITCGPNATVGAVPQPPPAYRSLPRGAHAQVERRIRYDDEYLLSLAASKDNIKV